MTPKTYDNHMCVRQTDKDNKIVQREQIKASEQNWQYLLIGANAIALE